MYIERPVPIGQIHTKYRAEYAKKHDRIWSKMSKSKQNSEKSEKSTIALDT